jgi:RimJ/RimL family protein N-acetyltransferase
VCALPRPRVRVHPVLHTQKLQKILLSLIPRQQQWRVQLKTGEILKKFNAKDGRNVILRTPRWRDLDDLLELINSLVDEKAEIYITQKFTREAEAEWLLRVLSRLEKDEQFFLVAEVDKRVVALSDFQVKGGDEEHRIGAIGIIVRNGYRNLGIGTEIMKTILEQAAFFGLRTVTVNAFATNKRAIHVYKKVGFVESSIIPEKHFRQGRLIDEVIMKKLID